MITEEHF